MSVRARHDAGGCPRQVHAAHVFDHAFEPAARNGSLRPHSSRRPQPALLHPGRAVAGFRTTTGDGRLLWEMDASMKPRPHAQP